MKKLNEAAVQIEKCSSPTSMPSLQPLKVIQSVKCVIKLMGNLCTLDLSMAVEELQRVCKLFLSFREVSAYCGEGRSLRVDFQKSSLSETIANICNQIREATRNLIEMYSQTFNVDFEMKRPLEGKSEGATRTSSASVPCVSGPAPVKNVPEISDMLVIRMCAIYRPHVDWKHDSFMVAAQIYHGTRPVGHPALSTPCVKTEMDHLWPARIIFNNW
jgi:phosphatidylinositol-4-phosphate 3-kinase